MPFVHQKTLNLTGLQKRPFALKASHSPLNASIIQESHPQRLFIIKDLLGDGLACKFLINSSYFIYSMAMSVPLFIHRQKIPKLSKETVKFPSREANLTQEKAQCPSIEVKRTCLFNSVLKVSTTLVFTGAYLNSTVSQFSQRFILLKQNTRINYQSIFPITAVSKAANDNHANSVQEKKKLLLHLEVGPA